MRRLARLLERAPGDEAQVRASQIVSELDPDSSLPVGTQPARATAATMLLKYSLAQERGAAVLGLENLTQTLGGLDTARVSGCLVQGPHQFALVFFTEDETEFIGVMCVTPPTGVRSGGIPVPRDH